MRIGLWLRRLVLAAMSLAFAAGIGLGQTQRDGQADRLVVLAAIEGPIGPATERHVEKVIAAATAANAEALVLRLYTPGGLSDSMRNIITEILGSRVPVIGYVAPSGAHAASAGTYILYACHIAVMAPGTNLGAATPVQIGGLPGLPQPGDEPTPGRPALPGESDGNTADGEEKSAGPPLEGEDAMTLKATNDAAALIRSLAELHGRNAEWAEKAVREAASLSAEQALKQGVTDLIASDVGQLLEKVDGRTVTVAGGERTLATRGLPVKEIAPDAITRLLGVLSNPNVALVLMMVGIYGIIFEFWNPGSVAPGVIGAISLTLGLYALNQLPLDYAGLALVGLGVAFMVAEAFTPSFGVLGSGGLAAFVLGAAMLIDTDVPEYQVSWWVIGTMAAMSGAVLVLLLGVTLRSYRRAPVAGNNQMIGTEGRILEWRGHEGFVWVDGERWRAEGPRDVAPGTWVRVRGLDGLTLLVEVSDRGDAARASTLGNAEE